MNNRRGGSVRVHEDGVGLNISANKACFANHADAENLCLTSQIDEDGVWLNISANKACFANHAYAENLCLTPSGCANEAVASFCAGIGLN